MGLNMRQFVWSLHVLYFITYCHLYLFSMSPRTSCQTFIKFHMFSSLQYIYFSRCPLLSCVKFLAVAISCKPLLAGTEARLWGYLKYAHTHTVTHTRLAARPGVSDYSCYLRHISRQRLSKSVHSAWHSTPSQAF